MLRFPAVANKRGRGGKFPVQSSVAEGNVPRMKHLLPLWILTIPITALRAQSDVVGVYLTWLRDPATTMVVNWVNLYPHTPATVWYRADTNAPWLVVTGTQHTLTPSTMVVRRAELTGLQPDTWYDFLVGAEPDKEAKGLRRFRTLPAALTRTVRFVAGGDMMHTREMADAMNRRAGELEPDFAVLGGDLAYEDGVNATRWLDWLQSWTLHAKGRRARCVPMIVGIGNHEVRGSYNGRVPDDAPYFYGTFALPEGKARYALDFGDYLSLLVLDSGHTEPVPAQVPWLSDALAARARQKFLFPVYHYPAYGTAKTDGTQLPCELPRAKLIRENWVPLFERHGVTAVFENDHHNFKRTHPLRGHQRDDANGIVYLGDGAWGVNTRTVPTNAWYLAKAEPRRHLFHVTLRPDGTARAEAVDAEGKVFDEVEFPRARTAPQP